MHSGGVSGPSGSCEPFRSRPHFTILRALTPLGDDPRRPDANVKKLAGYDDRYRLRVGDYRVIYEVAEEQLVILVVGVGHRREIYWAMS